MLGLTTTHESKSLKIVRNVAVGEDAIALHRLLADDDHELDDSCDTSDHQRAGFENHFQPRDLVHPHTSFFSSNFSFVRLYLFTLF